MGDSGPLPGSGPAAPREIAEALDDWITALSR
jgi:hypothetical protein